MASTVAVTRPRVRAALALTLALAACGAPQRAPAPAAPSASAAASATASSEPASSDPMLTPAPREAIVVGFVETAALRAHPIYGSVVAVYADAPEPPALFEACGRDPLEHVSTLGFWREANRAPVIALRGPVASPERAACAGRLAALFLQTEAPLHFARRGDTVLASADPAGASQARLDGRGPSAGSNPRHAALARSTEGMHVRVSFDLAERPLEERAEALTELGETEEQARQEAASVRGAAVGGVLDETRGLALSGQLALSDGAVARGLAPRVRERALRLVNEMRGTVDAAEREMGTPPIWPPEEFAEARRLLDRLVDVRTEAVASGVALQWDLAPDGVREVSDLAQRAYTRYATHIESAMTTIVFSEIVGRVEAYARGSTTAPRRPPGRLPPSAPRVPAEVPRGTWVPVTAESWAHPAWRALGFEPPAFRTRTSYELEVRGRRFTVRALTDRDGDGTPETRELSGHLDARHRVQVEPEAPTAPRR